MEIKVGIKNREIKISSALILIGIFILIALIVLVVVHFAEVEQFATLLSRAEPKWLFLAILFQLGTYFCVGFIWNSVIQTAHHRIPLGALIRLSIEKLSVDQLVPMGGISGNLIVIQTMKRFGLPDWLAIEAMLVDILSHYLASALMAFWALAVLWFYHDLTDIIRYLIAIFTVIATIIPVTIIWLLTHKNRQLPSWLLRFRTIASIAETVKSVSPEGVLKPALLGKTTLLCLVIFFLDGATLWTMMRITNVSVGMTTVLVAIVIATIAGAVSFLPGGIGGFEAGSVMTLSLLGVPVEAALTGTLLLRGFTLWLPLIPGILLAKHDAQIKLYSFL
ncbi:MAG TPA: lysylphosphatidylglycerol synthase transmembrane domain-containing protein [Atribacterota bacterium]|nr:lysylphosphatidylglycerol synthase transmembrane domain-containing protein [Atribacterota bacterium]